MITHTAEERQAKKRTRRKAARKQKALWSHMSCKDRKAYDEQMKSGGKNKVTSLEAFVEGLKPKEEPEAESAS